MTGPRPCTLMVLRHAKAAHDPALRDEDRPLTGRGRRDAAAAGGWLRRQGLIPGLVVCSPARRTRETWQQVRDGLGRPAGEIRVDYDRRLYAEVTAERLLAVVRETPAEVGLLLLVGHNPAVHQLVSDLTGQRGSFPATALAVIGLPGDWLDAAPGAGALARFWTPAAGALDLP